MTASNPQSVSGSSSAVADAIIDLEAGSGSGVVAEGKAPIVRHFSQAASAGLRIAFKVRGDGGRWWAIWYGG